MSVEMPPESLAGATAPASGAAPVVAIADLARHVGARVTVRGWLYNKRSSGKLAFLVLRDGTGWAQSVVARQEVSDAAWEAARSRLAKDAIILLKGSRGVRLERLVPRIAEWSKQD